MPKLGTREKEMLTIVEKSIRYYDKIVNDLLEYSGELCLELAEADPKSITRRISSYHSSNKNTHSGFD